jgi:heavy metal sensor kinase
MIRPLSIKWRLALWYLLIILLVLGFFSLISYFLLAGNIREIAEQPSRLVRVKPVSLTSSDTIPATPLPVFPLSLAVYNISGEWLEELQSQPQSLIQVKFSGRLNSNRSEAIYYSRNDGEQRVELFLLASGEDGFAYEILALINPIAGVTETLSTVRHVLFYAIPITAVLAAGLGLFLIWRLLKPISAINKAARYISEQDLSARIDVETNDELGQLGTTLNNAFERLERAFARERRFTADVSHELRTPIAIIQGETSLALTRERSNTDYRKSMEAISSVIEHMSTTINRLLLLARADAGESQLEMERVDLSGFLSDISADIEALCENKAQVFSLAIIHNAVITGDRTLLKELLFNLVENAVKHTPPGGRITIMLDKPGYEAVIEVKDSGTGIAAEHLPHIFERFYHVEDGWSSSRGSGLGLAICKTIVEQHKGMIEVESQIGKGSVFRISIPVSA